MKGQTSNNISENNNIINNVESLFSSKVKVLENELKEMKDIYKQNLEKLNKKKIENINETKPEKQTSSNQNQISYSSSLKNNIINRKSITEQDDNTEKIKKDVQENRYKIEQLENEIMTAKDMELTRLIYTVLENKGHNNQDEENTQNDIEKKSNMYNLISSQLSDLLKLNRFSNDNQIKLTTLTNK